MANIKKAAFIGTHFTMRTVGDMVEDYVHEKGFDATRLITKQYNSVPFIRDNVVKPTVETAFL